MSGGDGERVAKWLARASDCGVTTGEEQIEEFTRQRSETSVS
jgi:hypothetical protein